MADNQGWPPTIHFCRLESKTGFSVLEWPVFQMGKYVILLWDSRKATQGGTASCTE